MAVKPILFSTSMVQAILGGKKSMTRRVIHFPKGETGRIPDGGAINYLYYPGGIKYPNYNPGDILWVREAWAKHGYGDFCLDGFDDLHNDNPQYDDGGIMGLGAYIFKADGVKSYEEQGEEPIKWRPSIHVPTEACRLFLRVTDVRAEQLQEITPRDAWEEGCRIGPSFPFEDHIPGLQQMGIDILFRPLWDSLNAKRGYGWDVNPWVWVYSFERCEKPEGWC